MRDVGRAGAATVEAAHFIADVQHAEHGRGHGDDHVDHDDAAGVVEDAPRHDPRHCTSNKI